MKNLLYLPIKIDIPNVDYNISDDNFNLKKYDYFETWSAKQFRDINEANNHEGFKIILNQLPFKEITLFKQNTQLKDVMAHVDVNINYHSKGYITNEEHDNILKNEPAGNRIVLKGKKDVLEIFDGKDWKKVTLPEVPFAYIINSTKFKHRVVGDTGRKTLYIRGSLDENLHKQLIEKNLKEYHSYALFENNTY